MKQKKSRKLKSRKLKKRTRGGAWYNPWSSRPTESVFTRTRRFFGSRKGPEQLLAPPLAPAAPSEAPAAPSEAPVAPSEAPAAPSEAPAAPSEAPAAPSEAPAAPTPVKFVPFKSQDSLLFGTQIEHEIDFFNNFNLDVSPIKPVSIQWSALSLETEMVKNDRGELEEKEKESFNGAVYKVRFVRDKYEAFGVLKKSKKNESDNLMYEYHVGTYLNAMCSSFPSFVYTYGIYTGLNLPEGKTVAVPDVTPAQILNNFSMKTACNPVVGVTNLCLLTQYLDNSVSLQKYEDDNATDKYFEYNIFCILFQIYYMFDCMEDFSHNDLHFHNVLIYTLPNPIKFVYTLKNKKEFAFTTSCLVKIIDYGRCFFPESPDLILEMERDCPDLDCLKSEEIINCSKNPYINYQTCVGSIQTKYTDLQEIEKEKEETNCDVETANLTKEESKRQCIARSKLKYEESRKQILARFTKTLPSLKCLDEKGFRRIEFIQRFKVNYIPDTYIMQIYMEMFDEANYRIYFELDNDYDLRLKPFGLRQNEHNRNMVLKQNKIKPLNLLNYIMNRLPRLTRPVIKKLFGTLSVDGNAIDKYGRRRPMIFKNG